MYKIIQYMHAWMMGLNQGEKYWKQLTQRKQITKEYTETNRIAMKQLFLKMFSALNFIILYNGGYELIF